MDATKQKSALITGLVEKLKNGEISRSQLFDQLAVLKSSSNAAHTQQPSLSGHKHEGDPNAVENETTRISCGNVESSHRGIGHVPKLGNKGLSLSQTPNPEDGGDTPDKKSLLASGDRRTLVTRLLEEKRKVRNETIRASLARDDFNGLSRGFAAKNNNDNNNNDNNTNTNINTVGTRDMDSNNGSDNNNDNITVNVYENNDNGNNYDYDHDYDDKNDNDNDNDNTHDNDNSTDKINRDNNSFGQSLSLQDLETNDKNHKLSSKFSASNIAIASTMMSNYNNDDGDGDNTTSKSNDGKKHHDNDPLRRRSPPPPPPPPPPAPLSASAASYQEKIRSMLEPKKSKSHHSEEQHAHQRRLLHERNKKRQEQEQQQQQIQQQQLNQPPPPQTQRQHQRYRLGSDSRTRASEEMSIRRQNAVKEEMDHELTFSPKIRSLPSSYGKKQSPTNQEVSAHVLLFYDNR